MRVLVTGSAGHLGEALMRSLPAAGHEAIGLDLLASPFTDAVGTITDRALVDDYLRGVDGVIHAATLHKPHVATHRQQDFVDTNIAGTLALLEAAVAAGVGRFVFTSTTSAFGAALTPATGAPAAWVTEAVAPVPRNIYGVTKVAAEDLCELVHRRDGLPCVVLRTSRFFPEEHDNRAMRQSFADANAKANEFLFRRVDLEDVVQAHLLALERAPALGFDRYIVSATTPFRPEDAGRLRRDAAAVLAARCPEYEAVYARLGWRMFEAVDRVYVNDKARAALGWQPAYDFARVLARLDRGEAFASELSRLVGAKGYHAEAFDDGPYPVD